MIQRDIVPLISERIPVKIKLISLGPFYLLQIFHINPLGTNPKTTKIKVD